ARPARRTIAGRRWPAAPPRAAACRTRIEAPACPCRPIARQTCLQPVQELHHDGEHDISPPEGLGMVQAVERYKSGIRHVLNALWKPGSAATRLTAIQEARHLHRQQDVVQSGSVQLIRREGKKIVIEKLRLLLRGKRRKFESQPPGESLDERPGIGAIETVG